MDVAIDTSGENAPTSPVMPPLAAFSSAVVNRRFMGNSVLIGLLVPNDHWHKQAVKLWQATKAQGHTPVYLDCVTAETISVIVRRLKEKGLSTETAGAIRRWEEHIPTGSISWVLPDVPRLYPQIIALIRSSSGALNFNDALIALACRERGIEAIASFDEDFDQVDWLRRLARAEDLKG